MKNEEPLRKKQFKEIAPAKCIYCGSMDTEKERIVPPGNQVLFYCRTCRREFLEDYDFFIEMKEEDRWFFPWLDKNLNPKISKETLESTYDLVIGESEWRIYRVLLSLCENCHADGLYLTPHDYREKGIRMITLLCLQCGHRSTLLLDNDLL